MSDSMSSDEQDESQKMLLDSESSDYDDDSFVTVDSDFHELEDEDDVDGLTASSKSGSEVRDEASEKESMEDSDSWENSLEISDLLKLDEAAGSSKSESKYSGETAGSHGDGGYGGEEVKEGGGSTGSDDTEEMLDAMEKQHFSSGDDSDDSEKIKELYRMSDGDETDSGCNIAELDRMMLSPMDKLQSVPKKTLVTDGYSPKTLVFPRKALVTPRTLTTSRTLVSPSKTLTTRTALVTPKALVTPDRSYADQGTQTECSWSDFCIVQSDS